jgi:hypothetical protein
MCQRLITPLFLILLLTATVSQASWMPVLTLDNQDLSGAPGSRVGWGFSLYNDSPFDLYVLRVFADGTLFGTNGASAIGAFRDDINYNYPGVGITLATGATYLGSFPGDGLASFAINAGAPVGGSVNGKIYLDYEVYDTNLNFKGAGALTAQYNNQDALASVTVNASAVPEPSTYALLCIGLGVVGFVRRKLKMEN